MFISCSDRLFFKHDDDDADDDAMVCLESSAGCFSHRFNAFTCKLKSVGMCFRKLDEDRNLTFDDECTFFIGGKFWGFVVFLKFTSLV